MLLEKSFCRYQFATSSLDNFFVSELEKLRCRERDIVSELSKQELSGNSGLQGDFWVLF